jgi:hypothetical protein
MQTYFPNGKHILHNFHNKYGKYHSSKNVLQTLLYGDPVITGTYFTSRFEVCVTDSYFEYASTHVIDNMHCQVPSDPFRETWVFDFTSKLLVFYNTDIHPLFSHNFCLQWDVGIPFEQVPNFKSCNMCNIRYMIVQMLSYPLYGINLPWGCMDMNTNIYLLVSKFSHILANIKLGNDAKLWLHMSLKNTSYGHKASGHCYVKRPVHHHYYWLHTQQ